MLKYFFRPSNWCHRLIGHNLSMHWNFVENWDPSSHHSLWSHCMICKVVLRACILSYLVAMLNCEVCAIDQTKSLVDHFCCFNIFNALADAAIKSVEYLNQIRSLFPYIWSIRPKTPRTFIYKKYANRLTSKLHLKNYWPQSKMCLPESEFWDFGESYPRNLKIKNGLITNKLKTWIKETKRKIHVF